MALTKQDKEDIGQIIKEQVTEIVDVKVTKEIGLLRLEMNQRFDKTDQKIEDVRMELKTEIREVKQMETEDLKFYTKMFQA